MFRILFTLIITVCFASYADAQQDPTLVSLEHVLELAGSVAPTVLIAENEVQEVAYRRLEAQLAWLPQIRANVFFAPAPQDVNNTDSELDQLGSIFEGASYAMRGSIEAVLPIYTFGKIRLAQEIGELGSDVQNALLQQTILNAQFEAFRAYLVLQWYEEVDSLLREASNRLDDAEEALEIALDDGDRSARTSLRQLTIFRTDFVESRTEADQTARLAQYALVHALELPENFRVEPLNTEVEEIQVEQNEIMDFALLHRQDYRLLEANLQAAELNASIATAEMMPDFYAAFAINGRHAPSYDDLSGPFIYDPYNSFGLGGIVGMRWNFNISRRIARSMWRETQIITAEHEREGGRLLIELDIFEAFGEATSAFIMLEAHSNARRAATAWLNQVSFQYDQGLADFDDLVAPLRAYYETSGDYLQALLQFRLNVANLALQAGSNDFTHWPTQQATE